MENIIIAISTVLNNGRNKRQALRYLKRMAAALSLEFAGITVIIAEFIAVIKSPSVILSSGFSALWFAFGAAAVLVAGYGEILREACGRMDLGFVHGGRMQTAE